MTSATDMVLILGLVVGSLIVGLLLVFMLLRGLKQKLQARVLAEIPPERIVMADWFANNFGVQSRGVTQLRGNGALVLGEDELRFFMMVGNSELRIPLRAITGVSFVKSHLGKTVGRELLAIDFSNEANAPDRVALLVRDKQAWLQRLQQHAASGIHGASRPR